MVNRKRVYRLLKLKGWLAHQRSVTPRPRVHGMVSKAKASDQRWAMDVTHIPSGSDGWAHLAAVIDCHDREIVWFPPLFRQRTKRGAKTLAAIVRSDANAQLDGHRSLTVSQGFRRYH